MFQFLKGLFREEYLHRALRETKLWDTENSFCLSSAQSLTIRTLNYEYLQN